jgi:nicotinamidase-related amidase
MINKFAFPEAADLLPRADAAADAALSLRAAADPLGVQTIYVNDNYGEWASDRNALIKHCMEGAAKSLIRKIGPRKHDLFVIKPQFSGFYATNLPVLLPQLGVSRLVLTGIATDICVLFTAADAHMRDYELWVPADATASSKEEHSRWALEIMAKSMKANIRPTGEQSLQEWLEQANLNPPGDGQAERS